MASSSSPTYWDSLIRTTSCKFSCNSIQDLVSFDGQKLITTCFSLADSFARAGYFVLAVDLYEGFPAPDDHDRPDLGFDAMAFLVNHTTLETDPIVERGIRTLRHTFNMTRVGAAGYCFGGRYTFRFATAEKRAAGIGVDVIVAAHITNVSDEEIRARTVPTTIAAGRMLSLNTSRSRSS